MFPAFLIQIVIGLIVVGLILWLITRIPGIDPAIVQIIRVIVIVCVVIWLLYALMGAGSLVGSGPYLRR